MGAYTRDVTLLPRGSCLSHVEAKPVRLVHAVMTPGAIQVKYALCPGGLWDLKKGTKDYHIQLTGIPILLGMR